MAGEAQSALNPRKKPVQVRSAVTVEAIQEATIQVLLSHGADRLTTTRVAERAGVSVGTLYQYYPNKQALLFALLESHLDKVSGAVQNACQNAHGKPLAQMMQGVVTAFIDAKMAHTDNSTGLYRIASEVGGPALVTRTRERSLRALETMLNSAPDAALRFEPFAVAMLFATMAGTTRSVLETGATPEAVLALRHHLELLCQSYVMAHGRVS
jgi:AcrR family transcriptional regulator